MPGDKTKYIVPFFIVCGIAAALYYPILDMGYFHDDLEIIPLTDGSLHSLINVHKLPNTPIPPQYFRPLPWLVLWIFTKTGATQAPLHYVFNFAMHCANAMLVLALIVQGSGQESKQVRLIPSGFVLLFLLGPVSALSVVWISQIFDLVSTFLALLAMYTAGRWWQKEGSLWNASACIGAMLAAMLSKEATFILPLLLLAWYFLQHRRNSAESRSLNKAFWLVGAGIVVLVVVTIVRIQMEVPLPSAIRSGILPIQILDGFARSLISLAQPFTPTLLAAATHHGGGVFTPIFPVVGAFLLCWFLLMLFVARRGKAQAVIAMTLPVIVACSVYGLMGNALPRWMYFPFAVLCASFGSAALVAGNTGARQTIVLSILGVLVAMNGIAGLLIVRYYSSVDSYNQSQLYREPVTVQDSSFVAMGPHYSRNLFSTRHASIFAALYSREDPVFESLFVPDKTPQVRVQWASGYVMHAQSNIPGRYFFVFIDKFVFATGYVAGDTISRYGYRIIVEMDDRAKITGFRAEFDTLWLRSHSLYLDDGVNFQKISPYN